MIKELKRKFILTGMAAIGSVVLIIMSTANLFHYISFQRSADEKMDVLEKNDGILPSQVNRIVGWLGDDIYIKRHRDDETLFELRYYTVTLEKDGTVRKVDLRRTATRKRQEAIQIATDLWKQNKKSGFVDCIKYRAIENSDSTMYIFMNCHREITDCQNFLLLSIGISLGGLALVWLLLFLLSGHAIKPIIEGYDKQKIFITDASHELKTPLAIIQANTELLEMVNEENEWTQSILNQVQRMNHLVENMVKLTRLEEHPNEPRTRCDLSQIVEESVQAFEALAQSKGHALIIEVESDIAVSGYEADLRQLISILMDNAVKYAGDGEIKCVLKNRKHPLLQISNPAQGLKPGRQDALFERFYRTDASRNSETGGNGIGLSIAKAIVEKHGGKITAVSPDGQELLFIIRLEPRLSLISSYKKA